MHSFVWLSTDELNENVHIFLATSFVSKKKKNHGHCAHECNPIEWKFLANIVFKVNSQLHTIFLDWQLFVSVVNSHDCIQPQFTSCVMKYVNRKKNTHFSAVQKKKNNTNITTTKNLKTKEQLKIIRETEKKTTTSSYTVYHLIVLPASII